MKKIRKCKVQSVKRKVKAQSLKLLVLSFGFALCALSFSLPSACFAAELKIGYLDVGKTFDEYKKTKDLDAELEGQTKVKQAERDKMVSEITRLRDELQLLSEKGKADKQVIIDEKIKKLQEYDRVTRNELRTKRDEMVADILKEIDKVVQDYGAKGNYDMIFNDKVIVYKKDSLDITQDILKTLNSQYKK